MTTRSVVAQKKVRRTSLRNLCAIVLQKMKGIDFTKDSSTAVA